MYTPLEVKRSEIPTPEPRFQEEVKNQMIFEKNSYHKRGEERSPRRSDEALRKGGGQRLPRTAGRTPPHPRVGSGRVGPGLRRPHLGPPPGPEHLLEAGAVREPREEPGRAEVPFASSCRAPGPSRRRRLELALPFPSPPLPAPFRKLSRPPPAALRGDTAEVPALLYACAAVQPP